MIENPALFSRKGAAAYLSLAVSSIDRLIVAGHLRTRRIGRRVLVPRAELDRFARTDHPGPIRQDSKVAVTVGASKLQ